MQIPYANARSGQNARAEIQRMLAAFGCESVGFMDNYEDRSVLLAFRHRGRPVQLRASAAGWASLWLKQNPWSRRRGKPQKDYERMALEQGLLAVNSILRDWVKGQITAVECGVMSFDAAFMPFMVTDSGETVIERIRSLKLLPAPKGEADAAG